MNIRKDIDYSAMFNAMDDVMAAGMTQMELYCELGRLICTRPEKGAAVAAAEHFKNRYQDVNGFSPRNMRRMRDFYRVYGEHSDLLALSLKILLCRKFSFRQCQQLQVPFQVSHTMIMKPQNVSVLSVIL